MEQASHIKAELRDSRAGKAGPSESDHADMPTGSSPSMFMPGVNASTSPLPLAIHSHTTWAGQDSTARSSWARPCSPTNTKRTREPHSWTSVIPTVRGNVTPAHLSGAPLCRWIFGASFSPVSVPAQTTLLRGKQTQPSSPRVASSVPHFYSPPSRGGRD